MEGLACSSTNASFLSSALAASLRADGRENIDCRAIEELPFEGGVFCRTVSGKQRAEFSSSALPQPKCVDDLYSADEKEYATGVVVYVSTELIEPPTDSPKRGRVSIGATMQCPDSLMTTGYAKIIMGEKFLQQSLEKTFKDSKLIDSASLCVIPHKLVWHVKIDVCVVGYDGGSADLATYAVSRALQLARIPVFKHVRPDLTDCGAPKSRSSVQKHAASIDLSSVVERAPLSIKSLPLSLTVSFIKDDSGAIFFADPSYLEECAESGRVVVVLSTRRQIVSILGVGASLPLPMHEKIVGFAISMLDERLPMLSPKKSQKTR